VATRLPLFPLNSVLVPGLVLPLHVFEPRYRVLVQALMALPEDAERRFGVVAIRAGREVGADGVRALHAVGCTAELREVTPHDDGRFDLLTVGEDRFRLVGLDEDAGTPYHTGFVDFLPERDGDGDVPALAQRVTARFGKYRERLGVEVNALPDQPQVVSYLVAAAVVLDLPERQALLEQPTTADRLRAELEVLRREVALVGTFRSLPAVELAGETWSPN
jgi:Lon protease-like protein